MDLRIFPSTRTSILLGPLKSGTKPTSYEPVDCDFTDDLEFVSIYKLPVLVKHWAENGTLIESLGVIIDILTENKEEFLIMSTKIRIRLDRIFQLEIQSGR